MLEPGRQRLQQSEIAPLHSGLGDRARLSLKKKKQTKQKPMNVTCRKFRKYDHTNKQKSLILLPEIIKYNCYNCFESVVDKSLSSSIACMGTDPGLLTVEPGVNH